MPSDERFSSRRACSSMLSFPCSAENAGHFLHLTAAFVMRPAQELPVIPSGKDCDCILRHSYRSTVLVLRECSTTENCVQTEQGLSFCPESGYRFGADGVSFSCLQNPWLRVGNQAASPFRPYRPRERRRGTPALECCAAVKQLSKYGLTIRTHT